MGIDKSLSDEYPSVIINGVKYHYGRDPEGHYLVENANPFCAKDYWWFERKEDLVSFLENLPESADGSRLRRLHPDWHEVSDERRQAYMEEDRARLRVLAEAKTLAGTAQTFNMDLNGKHGPYHEPQRVKEQTSEPPMARVRRQLSELEPDFHGPWNDAGRLSALEAEVDWTGVSHKDKAQIICRYVDFREITKDQFDFVCRTVREHLYDAPDLPVARALFDESREQAPRDRTAGVTRETDQGTGETQLRDELKAGEHVLRRYYDLDSPPWSLETERWELSRVSGQGEELVMEGVGHDLRAIRKEVQERLLGRRIEQELPEVRELTRQVYTALIMDAWPSPAGAMDFGLETEKHYAALQWAVREGGVTPKELDAALGDGKKIQALVSESNPYRGIAFETAWANLPVEPKWDEAHDAINERESPAKGPSQGRLDAQEGPAPKGGEPEEILRETDAEKDERFTSLLFRGAPMPEGWSLPALTSPPAESEPEALKRAAEEIAVLKGARFDSWSQQTVDERLGAVMATPAGPRGGWAELSEWGKLSTMQHWVNFEGVSQRDRAAMLMDSVDIERLPPSLKDQLRQDAARGGARPEKPQRENDRPDPEKKTRASRTLSRTNDPGNDP